MKLKFKFLLSFLVAVLLCLCICAFAKINTGDIAVIKKDGFTTKITDKSGAVYEISGIIDAGKIEESLYAGEISDYEIFKGDTSLIRVNLFDIKSKSDATLFGEKAMQNGFYSTSFTLSEEDNTEVFLTGLTPENLEKVQEAFLKAVIKDSEFSLEDLDFIDAEKKLTWDDNDDYLCWAASGANMLHYTGWAKKANMGFDSPDDILDIYEQNFTDDGSRTYSGFEWFFDGFYSAQGRESFSQAVNYGQSGGFLKNYASSSQSDEYAQVDLVNRFYKDYKLLHEGYGFGMTIAWVDHYSGTFDSSHAVTLWGYICDRDFSDRDAKFLKALIISDSDDNMTSEDDRRSAPDTLHILNTEPYKNFDYHSWTFPGYDGVFIGYVTLKPYSDSIPFETDAAAKLDRINYPDIITYDVSLKQGSNEYGLREYDKFHSGSGIALKATLGNESAVNCSLGAQIKLSVTDRQSGKTIYNFSYAISTPIEAYNSMFLNYEHRLPYLAPGKYTVRVTLNEDRKIQEAYYYNNIFQRDFEIMENFSSFPSSFGATIGKFEKGVAKAEFSFGNINGGNIPDTAFGYIYKSVYKDGAWDGFEVIKTFGGAVPESGFISADGEKIKFRYEFYKEEGAEPLIAFSPEYALKYDKIILYATDENIYYETYLGYDERTLYEGDKFAFKALNCSTQNSGGLKYTVSVISKTDNTVLFRKENETLFYGAESQQYEVSSWDAQLSFGKHQIYAVLESNLAGRQEVYLGTLWVEEPGSNIVNIEEDIEDYYDGKISLREAMRYVANYPEAGEVIIPKGYKISLGYTLYIYGSASINGNGSEISCPENYCITTGYSSTVTLKNLTLNGNGCDGVFGINAYSCNMILDNVNIINMRGERDGVAIYATSKSKINARNCRFTNNVAIGNYITYASGASMNFLNCIWENNSTYGDLMYFLNSNITFSHCTLGGLNCLNAFAEPMLINSNNNSSVKVFSSIIAGDVSGVTEVYASFIGGKSGYYVSCDGETVVGEIDSVMLCGEDGMPVYEKDRYTLSENIKGGVLLKNEGGRLFISYDGTSWTDTYRDITFSTEDFSRDIEGKQGTKFIGAFATAATTGAIVDKKSGSITVFAPRGETVKFTTGTFDKNSGKLNSFKTKEISLSPGMNTILVEAENSSLDYRYMLWRENLEPAI